MAEGTDTALAPIGSVRRTQVGREATGTIPGLSNRSRARAKRPTKKERAEEIARIKAWLAETRKNYDFSRPVTKAEYDEMSGDNDLLRAMKR